MTRFVAKSSRPLALLETRIDSERLRLIPISEAHAEAILATFTADITTYMYPQPAEKIQETLAFIQTSRAAMTAGTNLQLTITDKVSGEFLGCCGLHGGSDPRTPELGIWLKRAAHGHGYGKEAVFALAVWAQMQLEVTAFIYPVDRRNYASRKIPEALGGRVVGTKTTVGAAGNRLELVTYRIDAVALDQGS